MNSNWNRWIFASISKHFVAHKDNLVMYVEGQEKANGSPTYAEVRYTGPAAKQITKTRFRLEVIVNVLLNCVKDNDNHKIFRMCGTVEKAFEPCIPVYKLGNGVDDNPNEHIGDLYLILNGNRDIETSHFGQPDPAVKIMQSTVEGNYRVELDDI